MWVDGPRIIVKRIVHLAGKKNTILDRVDSSMGFVCGRNSDKATIVFAIPFALVGERKDVRCFKITPLADMS